MIGSQTSQPNGVSENQTHTRSISKTNSTPSTPPVVSCAKGRNGQSRISTELPQEPLNTRNEHITRLIGRQAIIQCYLDGLAVHALLDTGAQVSMIDRSWKNKHLPHLETRPIDELMKEDDELEVYAVNGGLIPFDGWVAITVNYP